MAGNDITLPGTSELVATREDTISGRHYQQVDIVGPLSAFGEVKTCEKTPQVQMKWPYGLNDDVSQTCINNTGGSVSFSNGTASVVSANAAEVFTQIRSRLPLRYGPGQGAEALFTALFATGTALSEQFWGAGEEDEGIGFGFNETVFGILHRQFGQLEVRSLEITGAADAGGGDFVITMDGTAVTVTVAASDTISEVCAAIVAKASDFDDAGRGWFVYTPDNITVLFVSFIAENASGTFSFVDTDSGVTAGAFTQGTTVVQGVVPTDTWTPQTTWNIDRMAPSADGVGETNHPSGFTLDTTKLNVCSVRFQHLAAGDIFLFIEDKRTGRLQPVHLMQHAGTLTAGFFRNPTFLLSGIVKTAATYAAGALTIKSSSMAGFIEGKETTEGIRRDAKATVTTTGATPVSVLLLHSKVHHQGTRNKVHVFPDHITLINEATKSVTITLIINPTQVDGTVALTAVDATNSVMEFDSAGTTIVGGTESVQFSLSASSSKDIEIGHLGGRIRPADRWVFSVVKTAGGADGAVTVGLSWLERI